MNVAPGRLECDVGAVLRTLDPDLADPCVRALAGLVEVLASTADRKDPAAGGDDLALLDRGAGVEDADPTGLGLVDPADHVTVAGLGRVLLGRHHHRDRSAGLPRQRLDVGQLAGRRRVQEPAERSLEQRQQRLRLGVAEAAVELDHPDAARRERQAGVQQSAERRTAAAQLVDGRLEDLLGDLLDQLFRCPGQRCVGAHATGVGAFVVVTEPLEVLGRLHRQHRGAVGDREQRHLWAVQELLDQHLVALGRVGQRLFAIGGDDNSLACGKRIVLHHVRGAEGIDRLGGLLRRSTDIGPAGRHARRGHHVLGERLRSLDLCGLLGRTEDGDPGRAERIRQPGHQRCLGSDHDQVGAELGREHDHRIVVQDIHRTANDRLPVVRRLQRGDARVARGRDDLLDIRILAQGPDQCVFTAA